eukprot:gene10526-biopygen6508
MFRLCFHILKNDTPPLLRATGSGGGNYSATFVRASAEQAVAGARAFRSSALTCHAPNSGCERSNWRDSSAPLHPGRLNWWDVLQAIEESSKPVILLLEVSTVVHHSFGHVLESMWSIEERYRPRAFGRLATNPRVP